MKNIGSNLLLIVSLALVYGPICYVLAGYISQSSEMMPTALIQTWKEPGAGSYWWLTAITLAFGTAGVIQFFRHSARKP